MGEYCPYTPTCPLYQNWVEQTGSERIDIILTKKDIGKPFGYKCLALVSLNDEKSGIKIGNSLKSKLLNPDQKNFTCSHIRLLNQTERLIFI